MAASREKVKILARFARKITIYTFFAQAHHETYFGSKFNGFVQWLCNFVKWGGGEMISSAQYFHWRGQKNVKIFGAFHSQNCNIRISKCSAILNIVLNRFYIELNGFVVFCAAF